MSWSSSSVTIKSRIKAKRLAVAGKTRRGKEKSKRMVDRMAAVKSLAKICKMIKRKTGRLKRDQIKLLLTLKRKIWLKKVKGSDRLKFLKSTGSLMDLSYM